MAPPNTPQADLVLVFRSAPASASKYLSKQAMRENAAEAEAEYSRLLATLKDAGFKATGRRGQKNGQIIVLLWTPTERLSKMVQRERCVRFSVFGFFLFVVAICIDPFCAVPLDIRISYAACLHRN